MKGRLEFQAALHRSGYRDVLLEVFVGLDVLSEVYSLEARMFTSAARRKFLAEHDRHFVPLLMRWVVRHEIDA